MLATIFTVEDGDAEADELSLNSDYCIYVYRGKEGEVHIFLETLTSLDDGFGH